MTTITALPDPPDRDDPVDFAARADAFLAALQDPFVDEANAVASECNGYATAAAASATAADASADAALVSEGAAAASAVTAAASAGASIWVSGATYAIGDVRWSPATRYTYRRITAGAGTTDPSADATNWALAAIAVPALTFISAGSTTLVANQHAVLQNASASTATLPASPSAGDTCWVSPGNGRADNVVSPGAGNIMGIAASMTLDDPDATAMLRYIDATTGWRVLT